jgi:hypothetical protein
MATLAGALAAILAGPVGAFGAETRVAVQEGKVRVSTDKGEALVAAGQRATLKPGEKPTVLPDDPLVEQALAIDRWVQAEKEAGRTSIELSAVQVFNFESEKLWQAAVLMEMPNIEAASTEKLRFGPSSTTLGLDFYDMEGNEIPFEVEEVREGRGYHHLRFPKPVPPGGKFRFIALTATMRGDIELGSAMWQEENLWHVRLGSNPPNCLNYYRMILPRSGVFVDSSPPAVCLDSVNGRVAVTVRNYTGPQKDGNWHMAFLWPDKDGTSLADLPPRYRGLRGWRDVELSEKFRSKKAAILAGEHYRDLSSPLDNLLTWMSAVASGDKELWADCMYGDDRQRVQKVVDMFADGQISSKYWFVDNLDFLSSPPLPEKPKEGQIHPIYVCQPGSLLRSEVHVFVFHGGRWLRMGKIGNPRNTDLSVFEQMLPGPIEDPP